MYWFGRKVFFALVFVFLINLYPKQVVFCLCQPVLLTLILAKMWPILLFFLFLADIPITKQVPPTSLPKDHIRHVIFYEYSRGTTGTQAAQNINSVYGKGSTTEQTCRNWFSRFRSGETDLSDKPRAGRPSELNEETLIQLLKEDNRQPTRILAEQLGTAHSTVVDHLHALGYTNRYGNWIPHDLKEADKWQRMSICGALLTRYMHRSFLPRLITGDEKYIFYANYRRRKQWIAPGEKPRSDPRPEIHRKKLMLSVWWDMEGPIH